MKRPHASDDVRERALAAVDAGRRVVDVAAYFQTDPSTIRRWIRQRARTGSAKSRPRPGRARLIGPTEEAALRRQIEVHPDATVSERCALLETESGLRVSAATMRRALRRLSELRDPAAG